MLPEQRGTAIASALPRDSEKGAIHFPAPCGRGLGGRGLAPAGAHDSDDFTRDDHGGHRRMAATPMTIDSLARFRAPTPPP